MHMAQLILLPLTVCCSTKFRLVLVLPFWYWLTQLGQNPESCKMVVVVVVVQQ